MKDVVRPGFSVCVCKTRKGGKACYAAEDAGVKNKAQRGNETKTPPRQTMTEWGILNVEDKPN
jgi:hypothetical protein